MAVTKMIMISPWECISTDDDDDADKKIILKNNNNKLQYGHDKNGKLCEYVANVARLELREEESTRQQAIDQFIEWIQKNPDLKDCRIDSNFLLRFLRVKKFSVPMAQNMLLKYLNLRQTFPQLLMNLDYLHTPVLQLIDKGYLFPSPVRDKKGRIVVIGIASNFDPQKYTCEDMAKVHMLTYETLLDDEDTQVLGFTHFGDFKTMSTAHVMLWSPTVFATIFKWGEHSIPMRHKEVHFINVPSALKYVYDFTRSRLSQKIRDRFTIHGSIEEVHTKLDPRVLPKEYGGEIPMEKMIAQWKEQLARKRDIIMALDQIKLLDNKCLLKKDKNNNKNKTTKDVNDLSITGSFRKLEVD